MVKKEKMIVREKLGGSGIGIGYYYEIVKDEELGKAGRMFAKIL